MILAVDIGNTRVKVGVFEGPDLREVMIFAHEDFPSGLAKRLGDEEFRGKVQYMGCASVGNLKMLNALEEFALGHEEAGWLRIDHETPLPVSNAYASPTTLGMDRICACVGARARTEKGPLLAIDAGTAITYDYLDGGDNYQGGGIAPGMRLRFQALHDHTASLPLVETKGDLPLVGYNTETSIRSGVINGLLSEIEGICERYRSLAGPELKVFLTGGDADFLGNHLKSITFVDSNLLLYGIHAVITYNLSSAS